MIDKMTAANSSVARPCPAESPSNAESSKISQAALQFESLMIGEMMRLTRESTQGGGLSSGGDEAGRTMSEYADQHLAEVIASQGGLGLAVLVKQGLLHGTQPQRLNCADSPTRSA